MSYRHNFLVFFFFFFLGGGGVNSSFRQYFKSISSRLLDRGTKKRDMIGKRLFFPVGICNRDPPLKD